MFGAVLGAIAGPVLNGILGGGGGGGGGGGAATGGAGTTTAPNGTTINIGQGVGQAAGNLLTGAYGAGQISNAGNALVNAGNAGIGTQQNFGSQITNTLAPYTNTGAGSLQNLAGGLGTVAPGSLQASGGSGFNMATAANNPAYNFALQQGLGAINNAADLNGTAGSTPNAANLATYASGLASQTENQAFNQYLSQQQLNNSAAQQNATNLSGLAGLGLSAAGTGLQGLQGVANQVTGLQGDIGTANAGSILGQANAYAGATNAAGNALAQSGALQPIGNAIGGLVGSGISSISNLFGAGSGPNYAAGYYPNGFNPATTANPASTFQTSTFDPNSLPPNYSTGLPDFSGYTGG